ncbi:replication protein A 70 kDa DNA-binding subunit B-like [Henckelia pumila]|uniref:replication protein A 70 kDa DNA-binding subunit B-like n=1 Tax=Henckelia pumila TaxID=405737 RepID=UPI003C6E3C19
MIHGIMFENIIQIFEDQMKVGKTYIIENPIVQPIQTKYPNVNKRIELRLHRGTIVNEAQPQLICDSLNFDFKEFAYIKANPATDHEHDVIGILIKVRQLIRYTKQDKITFGYRREIILMNSMLQTITINLWDDLALNEGQLLEENRTQNSIVAFCNLKMSIYNGFHKLQSTFTTEMLQNPKCSEAERINLWYRLTMTVQDNDTSAKLTLFEDVASDFIGCSVKEYMELLDKESNETKFPIALDNTIKRQHVFLFKMDQRIYKQKNTLSIVMEAFQKPQPEINTKISETQEVLTSCRNHKRKKKKRESLKIRDKQDDVKESKLLTDETIEIKDDENIAAFTQRRRRMLNQRKDAGVEVISMKKGNY